jgi:hypothetical protein
MLASSDVPVCCVHNVVHVVDLIRALAVLLLGLSNVDKCGREVLHLQEEILMFGICLMHQLHIKTRVCVC